MQQPEGVRLLPRILIEIEDADYPFPAPAAVLYELDIDKEPIGVADLYLEGGRLYANLTLKEEVAFEHLYPTIAFHPSERKIYALSLSLSPNSDARIQNLGAQLAAQQNLFG